MLQMEICNLELIHDKIIFNLLLINFCSIWNAEFNDVKIPSTYSQVEWTAARFIHIVYMAVNGQTNFFSCKKLEIRDTRFLGSKY